ncbi:potassium channel family protein [Leifsonia sp. YAF41]|uniref:potassium channel family protein n=1 Tax=Leifsonia sp. YAF41 TaxID=3233086 RepID=UPI003F9B0AB3
MNTEKVDAARRQLWENRTGTPLLIASAFFLFGYSVLVLVPELAQAWQVALTVILGLIWVAYIVDLIVRVSLTPRRSRTRFLRTHSAEVASAVVPIFRPFQLLTLLPRLRWFRGNSGGSVRSRLVVAALAFATLFIYVIALAVLAVERDAPNATIVSFGDSIWWACVTVATVGYGDYTPVTVTGRLLAVVLMAGGIAIIGTASATIVSVLNERITHVRQSHAEGDDSSPDA